MLVVGDQAEGQPYVKFGRIRAFGDHGVAREHGRMLERHAEPRPEASPRNQFAVGGAAVVVRPDGRPRGHIALPARACGYQEGVVVMLLVGGENEIAHKFTAGDGAVVAEHGIEETHAAGQSAACAQREAGGDAAARHPAAGPDHAVGEHGVPVNGHGLLPRRAQTQRLQPHGRAYTARGAALQPVYIRDIGYHAAGSDRRPHGKVRREPAQAALHLPVVRIFRHQPGVSAGHSRESMHLARAVLVHDLDDRSAEAAVRSHLADVEQQAAFTYIIAAQEAHVVDRTAVGYGARVNARIADSDRQPEPAALPGPRSRQRYAAAPREAAARHERRIKAVGHLNVIPVGRAATGRGKSLPLGSCQFSPCCHIRMVFQTRGARCGTPSG